MTTVTLLLSALGLAGLWLLGGLLEAVRKRLAERFAEWLLPAHQAPTIMLAVLLLRLADLVAPRSRYFISASQGSVSPHLRKEARVWHGALEALSEIEADMRSVRRVIAPVRLVAPLLLEAVRLRIRHIALPSLYFLVVICLSVVYLVVTVADSVRDARGKLWNWFTKRRLSTKQRS